METSNEVQADARRAADQRRWLIGIGITVAFGLFGVVMALLSYNGRSKGDAPAALPAAPLAPAGAPATTEPAHPAARVHGKGHGRD